MYFGDMGALRSHRLRGGCVAASPIAFAQSDRAVDETLSRQLAVVVAVVAVVAVSLMLDDSAASHSD